jgi:adenylate cyclase
MTVALQIRVYEHQQQEPVYTADCSGPVELGRQNDANEIPYSLRSQDGQSRLVIARMSEHTISRKHVRFEPLPDGRVRLTNVSQRHFIRLPDDNKLGPGGTREVFLPAMVGLGRKIIRLKEIEEPVELHSLAESPKPPGQEGNASSGFSTFELSAGGALEVEGIFRWLRGAMGVLQSAANSSDFFTKAARAMVDLVGLSSGRVLLFEQGQWNVQAVQRSEKLIADTVRQPSQQVLSRVLAEKKTFRQVPSPNTSSAMTMLGINPVVAAPILDRHGEVIGVLYGDRGQESGALDFRTITKLEAMLVELLAGGVAAGLARVEQEQAALRAKTQLEQFFTPSLARQLAERPDLLQGRDVEVSVLFADIRAFSRISERLGPEEALKWIGEVMSALSDCVLDHQGVLVDYVGDEVMAMWGAPEATPDHVRLACRAALTMLDRLGPLNDRWNNPSKSILGEPIALGIGINTGIARVGNVGSTRKFKYGPLGTTVNLAKRVQGLTKHLQTTLLVTGTVHAHLGAEFEARRLCQARVVNIAEPVDLYELAVPGLSGWSELKQAYEEALDSFEKQKFPEAAGVLGKLLSRFRNDGPSLALMARVANCLSDPARFDLVWEPPSK